MEDLNISRLGLLSISFLFPVAIPTCLQNNVILFKTWFICNGRNRSKFLQSLHCPVKRPSWILRPGKPGEAGQNILFQPSLTNRYECSTLFGLKQLTLKSFLTNRDLNSMESYNVLTQICDNFGSGLSATGLPPAAELII